VAEVDPERRKFARQAQKVLTVPAGLQRGQPGTQVVDLDRQRLVPTAGAAPLVRGVGLFGQIEAPGGVTAADRVGLATRLQPL